MVEEAQEPEDRKVTDKLKSLIYPYLLYKMCKAQNSIDDLS